MPTTDATLAAEPFLAGVTEAQQTLATRGPGWVRLFRAEQARRFLELGLPSSRQEAWKATSVAPLAGTRFAGADRDAAAPDLSDLPAVARLEFGSTRLGFVNGLHSEPLSSGASLPRGLKVLTLARALETLPDEIRPLLGHEDATGAAAFRALNGANLSDGAVIVVEPDTEIEEPIHLLYCTAANGRPVASHPRTLILAGRGSRVRVVETYCGLGPGVSLTNGVTDIEVADNASVEHCRVQFESPEAFHLSGMVSRQGRDSRFTTHSIDLGSRLTRHDTCSILNGEGAVCRLNGLYHTRDSQHVDNHTVLDHARPHGSSRELYKGILEGASRTVFNGRIVVRQDAQKTDAVQSNPNLLLSGKALAHTRPQLEIYADDVKCTHGATVGRLDEEAIFYLRSRALDHDAARNLLINSFAAEVLEQITIEPVRDFLVRTVAERLVSGR